MYILHICMYVTRRIRHKFHGWPPRSALFTPLENLLKALFKYWSNIIAIKAAGTTCILIRRGMYAESQALEFLVDRPNITEKFSSIRSHLLRCMLIIPSGWIAAPGLLRNITWAVCLPLLAAYMKKQAAHCNIFC